MAYRKPALAWLLAFWRCLGLLMYGGAARGDYKIYAEEATYGENRSFNKQWENLGEPVSTNAGAYFFHVPLLKLGGR